VRRLMTLLAAVAGAVAIGVVPAGAIVNGTPDNGAHPMVGQLLFYIPDEIDPRFDDPGAWFNCSGTLLSPTVVLTAGHCTFGVGLDGEPTTETGGDGGNDVWVNFEDEPDYSILPPSSTFVPDRNQERYEAWSAALNASDEWHRGTSNPHPDFNPNAFFLFDAGVVVLDEPIALDDYGELPDEGILDEKDAKKELYTTVGYGLNESGPKPVQQLGGDIRFKATLKLANVNGTFGIPDGVAAKFSSNNGQPHQGGTCFGDSGGPIFREGTLEIVAVTSFGINLNCAGTSGGYRIDQEDDLEFVSSFLE
jgi:hypothetical protein